MVKVFKPEPIGIGMGLIILISIYFLPVIGFRSGWISLSRYVDYCGSGSFSCSSPFLQWIFYLLWVTAIFFV